ncbi:hypothetical protein GGE12_006426 [Rhizobium mongolense]|uniref:Uncharacterized protein n=1 Tax=Rhizobium mongolense TaxID=57676 RepID=A0A7W6WI19_9HYPH|nr:hypothetical protein [Rhizobium mongolense]
MLTLYRQNFESLGYQEIKRLYNPRTAYFFQLTCANFERDRRGDFSQKDQSLIRSTCSAVRRTKAALARSLASSFVKIATMTEVSK